MVGLIEKDLSEPYSIFTYRYFINNWPKLCIMVRPSPCYSSLPCPVAKTPARATLSACSMLLLQAMCEGKCVGVIVNKLEHHRHSGANRGSPPPLPEHASPTIRFPLSQHNCARHFSGGVPHQTATTLDP